MRALQHLPYSQGILRSMTGLANLARTERESYEVPCPFNWSPEKPCKGDAETAAWLEEALDAERPDMVVSVIRPDPAQIRYFQVTN
jgi:hypothetical protein